MQLPTDTIGRFRLIESLSDQPERAVYLAQPLESDARVVLKLAILGDPNRSALTDELANLRELRGAAVAPVLAYGSVEALGVEYLVFPPSGPSLADLLAVSDEQCFSPPLAVAAIYQLALAVKFVHSRKWIHGDIKPSNVVFSPDSVATLIDLECARRMPPPTSTRAAPGTPPFLPPEVLIGGVSALSPAADVWALGVTLYLAILGRYPFGEGSVADLKARLANRTPPSFPDHFPIPIREVIIRLLSFDPSDRPADAGQVVAMLTELWDQIGGRSDARRELSELIFVAGHTRRKYNYSFDIASVALEPPEQQTQEPVTDAPQASTAPGQTSLRRRAATRWFRRMNPHRTFDLTVFFSGGELRVVAGEDMGVSIGQNAFVLDRAEPDVEVEPCFPGCLVTPPRVRLDLTPEQVTAKFWITPLAEGELSGACVRVYYRGRLVEILPTPTRVVGRTIARISAIAGVCWPIVMPLFESWEWTWADQFRDDFPLLRSLLDALGTGLGTLILMAGFFLVAGVLYWVTRPLPCRDDLPVTMLPELPEPATQPLPTPPDDILIEP